MRMPQRVLPLLLILILLSPLQGCVVFQHYSGGELLHSDYWKEEKNSYIYGGHGGTHFLYEDLNVSFNVLNVEASTMAATIVPVPLPDPASPEQLTVLVYLALRSDHTFDPEQTYITFEGRKIPVTHIGIDSYDNCISRGKVPRDNCIAYKIIPDLPYNLPYKSMRSSNGWLREQFYLKFGIYLPQPTDQAFTLRLAGFKKNGRDVPPLDVLFRQATGVSSGMLLN